MNEQQGKVRRTMRIKDHLPLILIVLGSAALRLIHLDYSHFQGDELSALYPLNTPFPESLIEQLKGPVQLLITLAVRSITGTYGEWETRFPFSLASLSTVFIVYLFVREAFSRRTALLAGALVGSCGLLVAFGRIVQYQAIVMLSVSLSALFLLRWLQTDKAYWLYLGLISYAIGILSHYDALTFFPALIVLLLLGFRLREKRSWIRIRHILLAGCAALILAGLFYIPFIFRPGFASVTDYLQDRVIGTSIRATFQQTYELLRLYFPPLYLTIISILAFIGSTTLFTSRKPQYVFVILVWIAAPFAFYMFLGGDPRSHVYMYVFPTMILAALGIDALVSIPKSPRATRFGLAVAWIVIASFGSITYYMMVDHSIEYPWEAKTVLGYEPPNLVSGHIQGVFGFPYNRGLDLVGGLFRSRKLKGTVGSNERYSTVEFYFDAPRSSPPVTYFDDPGSLPPDYYFYVHRPFSLRRELPKTVEENYTFTGYIQKRGRRMVDIYAAPWSAPLLIGD